MTLNLSLICVDINNCFLFNCCFNMFQMILTSIINLIFCTPYFVPCFANSKYFISYRFLLTIDLGSILRAMIG